MMIKSKQSGFTLIELMITVAIVAILLAVALPSFQDSVRKSRRTDAKIALTQMAALQERWYFTNNGYTSTITDLGANAATSPEGYYTIAVADNDGVGNCTTAALNCFIFTATAAGGQTKDTDCDIFTLDSLGNKTAKKSGGAANNICWDK